MATLSKNDLSFVKPPPEEIEIECTKCLQVMLDDPHLVSCCGHHFCGPCIKRVKHSNQPCPYCKEKEFLAVSDKSSLRYINGLQVNCTNKGCGWKGELKSLSSHIKREKREGECQFEVVKCKNDNCAIKQQRQHLKIHEEEKCDQRPYGCKYCRHRGTYQYITQQHYPQCTRYPVPCPNKCKSDGRFPRGDIEGHLSTVCPLQPVECEFKWAGCHYSPLRKDLPQHNIESQLNHMSLLAKCCGELKRENAELKRNNGELMVMCQELKSDNEEFKRKNAEWMRDNSVMKQLLVNIHHAVADDHHPLPPVTVTWGDKGVQYFYSEPCGHLMSVEGQYVMQQRDINPIIIKVLKRKSRLPLVSEITIKYRDDEGTTMAITKDNCLSYKETSDERNEVIQEFKINMLLFICCKCDIVHINYF